jgi:hypothetical protein
MFQEAGGAEPVEGGTAMNLIWAHPIPLSTSELTFLIPVPTASRTMHLPQATEVHPTEVGRQARETVEAFDAVTHQRRRRWVVI